MKKLLSPLLVLTIVQAPARGLTDEVPIARQAAPGIYTIWSSTAPGADPLPELAGVRFLDLELVGYPQAERLRVDRPTRALAGAGIARVRLPQGGSLFRVAVGGTTAVLHVRAGGSFALLGSIPDVAGQPGLMPQIHVAVSGARALVASPPGAGGGVFLLDLVGSSPAVALTSGEEVLPIHGESLRVGASSAWFVAGGVLYRAPDLEQGAAEPVELDLGPGEIVLPELALAAASEALVAVVESTPDARRLLHVSQAGPYITVTTTPGDYAPPAYDHPLGPWLAISPDGSLVAFRGTTRAEQLFVMRAEPGAAPFQVTAPPFFLNGIDNIGVIGLAKVALISFLDSDHLAFFTGDIEQEDSVDQLESGELFVADLTEPAALMIHNITQSSGEAIPPYSSAGDLEFEEIVFDPLGERMLFYGQTAEFESSLVSFRVDTITDTSSSKTSPPSTMEVLLEELDDAPQLTAAGHHLLVRTSEETDDDGPGVSVGFYVLQPAQGGASASLVAVGTFDEDVVLDRFATVLGGDMCAFVARDDEQVEQLFTLVLSSATLELVQLPFASYSSSLAFSASGRLHFGFGSEPGQHRFAALDPRFSDEERGLCLTLIDLPAGQGFPLVP